jgi:hypothetical protein
VILALGCKLAREAPTYKSMYAEINKGDLSLALNIQELERNRRQD